MTRTLLILLLLLPLAACGKKGPVRPLFKPLPAAPRQVEARQLGSDLVLSMELPERNQDGTPLGEPVSLRIFRRETAGGVCNECDEPQTLWREVDAEYPVGARLTGNRLTVYDNEVRPGYGYRYRLVPVTRSGISGDAISVSRVVGEVLPAPTALTARPLDRMVRLAWQPPEAIPEGWEASGCNVFRSVGEAPFGEEPLNFTLVTDARYDDIGPDNGVLYRYQVRCLARRGNMVVESESSAVVTATPQVEE